MTSFCVHGGGGHKRSKAAWALYGRPLVSLLTRKRYNVEFPLLLKQSSFTVSENWALFCLDIEDVSNRCNMKPYQHFNLHYEIFVIRDVGRKIL